MANSLMYADVGVSVFEGVAGYLTERTNSRLESAIKKHNEAMVKISALMSRNAINSNRVAATREAVFAEAGIDSQSDVDIANAKVAAAAAGVAGTSVGETIQGLRRSRLNALTGLGEALDNTNINFMDQERGIQMSRIMGRNTQITQKPSLGMHLLGTAAMGLDAFDRHQPVGMKATDRLETIADGYRQS